MNIPKLDPVSRSREYKAYCDDLRSQVVAGWLFDGVSHRKLDHDVLGLDPAVSKGYQSMGILHFLGLKKEFRGAFAGAEPEAVVAALAESPQDFQRVIAHLEHGPLQPAVNLDALRNSESDAIDKSKKDSSEARKKRILASSKKPPRMRVYSYTYRRNADVVAEALARADGTCESCAQPAPFFRASDGSPFLEVHQVRPLGDGGEDRLENVLALCPNCHRKAHFGKS